MGVTSDRFETSWRPTFKFPDPKPSPTIHQNTTPVPINKNFKIRRILGNAFPEVVLTENCLTKVDEDGLEFSFTRSFVSTARKIPLPEHSLGLILARTGRETTLEIWNKKNDILRTKTILSISFLWTLNLLQGGLNNQRYQSKKVVSSSKLNIV